ncbi:MAG TPA: hypothetical protein VHG08_00820 [Longimicrobium sp.]|nr:hypothetical protein [Longimicrobium sp.]
MARRVGRLVTWGLGGVALGVALLLLLLNVVARTERGHEFVLGRTLAAAGNSLNGGRLIVERIDGNLFEGAKLYGVRLEDRHRRAFLVADSAFLDYRVTNLVRVHIRKATLYDPEVYVFKLPGDTLWNYEAIFADTTARDSAQARRQRAPVRIDTLRVTNGLVRLQMPWEPDSALSPAARRRAVAAALSDTSQALVDSVAGGYLQTMNVSGLTGRITGIRVDRKTGTRVNIDSLRATLQVFRRPSPVSLVQTKVAMLPAYIELDAPQIRLPRSLLSVSGVVRTDSFPAWFREGGQMFDLALRSDSLAFRDLQWLYPRFPAEMRGRLSLRVEHRPGGLMVLLRDGDITAPGTHIVGSFGAIVGDTLRFVDVDLTAEPVRVGTIERMLPEGLPVRGLVLGGVEIRGGDAGQPAEEDEEEGEP